MRETTMATSRMVALVVAPWRTITEAEMVEVKGAVGHLVSLGWAPLFYPLALAASLDDNVPGDRTVALECSKAMVQAVAFAGGTMFVLDGRTTDGMSADIEAWMKAMRRLGYSEMYRVRTLTMTALDSPRGEP